MIPSTLRQPADILIPQLSLRWDALCDRHPPPLGRRQGEGATNQTTTRAATTPGHATIQASRKVADADQVRRLALATHTVSRSIKSPTKNKRCFKKNYAAQLIGDWSNLQQSKVLESRSPGVQTRSQ